MQHSDPRTLIHETFEYFCKSLEDNGLKTVILTWRGEWAPHTTDADVNHGDVVFGNLREATLLAYHGPTGSIHRFTARGEQADRVALRQALEAAGFQVEERCRNVT